MFLGRTQGVLAVEVLSIIPVIIGCVLVSAGWPMLRVLAFPIGFLFFAIPAPDWMIDAVTVPLKVFISDLVTRVLYAAGYPIAQNGVMIMIGSYQVLVKDACSGMNSIFALSAIGVFYAYAFRWDEKLRSLLLLAAIVPITIVANFIRVVALVLIAYYGGVDLLEGTLHDLDRDRSVRGGRHSAVFVRWIFDLSSAPLALYAVTRDREFHRLPQSGPIERMRSGEYALHKRCSSPRPPVRFAGGVLKSMVVAPARLEKSD